MPLLNESRIPRLSETRRMLKVFPLYVMPYKQPDLELHAHDFMELVYVTHGFGGHVHGKQEYPIHRGDCFMVLPGDPHGYRNAEDLRIVNILFYPRIFGDSLAAMRDLAGFNQFFSLEPALRSRTAFKYKLHFSAGQDAQVSAIVNGMHEEQERRASGHAVALRALFLQLAVLISRCYEENMSGGIGGAGAAPQERIARAIDYIESQFDKELSLSQVASAVCVSAGHLAHIFKASTGMSLFDYLLNFRIDKARHLLRNTDLSISESAFACGFNDSAYFSRAFKKITGQTPRQFRKSVAG